MNTPLSLAFLALVCFGLISFCLKLGGDQQAYGPSYMLAHSVGFLLVAVVMHIAQRHRVDLSPRLAGLAAVGGILGGIGTLAVITAFRIGGQGSIIFPISSLGLIIAVVLSYIVFREAVTVSKLLGLGFAATAIVFLTR